MCLLFCAVTYARGRVTTHEAEALSGIAVPVSERDDPPADPNAVIGSLDIPSVGLHVPVLASCSTNTLSRGTCLLQGTAQLGGLGNTGIAGHRDTSFRALEKIKGGEEIRIASHGNVFEYTIDSTEIVAPDNVDVLNIQDTPGLTLITCYPFHYIGSAPKRFIVHAHLLYLPVL